VGAGRERRRGGSSDAKGHDEEDGCQYERGDGAATVSGSAPADASERHNRRDYRNEAQQGSERRRGWDNREQRTEDGDDDTLLSCNVSSCASLGRH
jgi:hypothetical protein